MSKTYLIAGHGAGDCGAAGNGYQEADLTRKIANSLYGILKNQIEVALYDTSKNLYKSKDYSSFESDSRVVEIHLNSATNTEAKGTEILVKTGLTPDSVDTALLNAMAKYFKNRGVKYSSTLGNMNNFATLGINYVLIEVCFICNASDVSILINQYDSIIADIATALGGTAGAIINNNSTAATYRVRKTWADASSQIGAFTSLANAKALVDKNAGYSVFDGSGTAVYTLATAATTSFQVKVSTTTLRIRTEAGTSYASAGYCPVGTYTITEQISAEGYTWGKLKSGKGWIALEYTSRV